MPKNELPSIKGKPEVKQRAVPEVKSQQQPQEHRPLSVLLEIEVFPYSPESAFLKRSLNMTKRLNERQAKALRAIVMMHGANQTQAIQFLLDKVADAIESQGN